MSQEQEVNSQVDEELENHTDTDNSSTEIDSNSEPNSETGTNTQAEENDSENAATSIESDENEGSEQDDLTDDQINSMSDDEFVEYMNSGKLPDDLASRMPKAEDKSEEEEKPTPDKAKVVRKAEKEEPKAEPKTQSTGIDYEQVYKRIFSPFKANGKEITPRTVDDVISLMQMGANYTKKMQVMAPMRKIVESLNAAKISEDDLNFLIDLHKGDKEAIKQLLKKNEIETLDLDLDEIKYKPNKKNIASDEDVAFSETISEISDSLPQIQEILNSKWDAESKKLLLNDPRAMVALHEEIQMGRFDKVQQRLELEKTFGRYKGVPDVQAYIDLVNRMVAEEQSNVQTSTKNTSKPNKSVPDKRKAAPTRGTPQKSSSSLTAKDLFSMSDEEFNRLSIKDIV